MPRRSGQSKVRLANQILALVRDARFEPGHHLREQQIGDLMQVSRTPVRAALGLLAERGIVEARRNQGFFLKAAPEELDRIEVQPPVSAEEDLYALIVRDRLKHRLPSAVNQADLARFYDVDRTVLQRTLGRLVDDGLLIRKRGRGWAFPPALDSRSALRDSYEFRLAVEPAGLRAESFRFDAADLQRCRLQHLYLEAHPRLEEVARSQLFQTDAQFHEMVAAFSGNMFVLQAVQQQNRLRQLLEFEGYVSRRRIREWCREHLMILDAIEAGDGGQAAAIMQAHLSRALESATAADGLVRTINAAGSSTKNAPAEAGKQ